MRVVEPIRDMDRVCEIEEMLSKMEDARGKRMYLLFMCGIYLGLRISDLLRLRVGDIRGETLRMREKKTRKNTELPINPALRKVVRERLRSLPDDAPVFLSRQRGREGELRPITRATAYNDIKAIAKSCEIYDTVGCHTMRKTFGYHMYKATNGDIAFLMDWFNHSDQNVTKRYIGINLDERRSTVKKLHYARKDV